VGRKRGIRKRKIKRKAKKKKKRKMSLKTSKFQAGSRISRRL